jgi:hypothetical protein
VPAAGLGVEIPLCGNTLVDEVAKVDAELLEKVDVLPVAEIEA